ncbi:MAG: beta-mannanase [Planctomycetes bacterium]|nr:beta-mannanase [Planctomycetota bacterium]
MKQILALIVGLCVASLGDAAEPAAEPALGTYHWPVGTAGVDAFAGWLNRPAVWGLDFIGGESWDNVEWPTYWLDAWGKWTAAKPGRRLILAVPMLAGPVDGSGPKQGTKGVNVPVSLARGAAGDYNQHFRQLAENLVAYKLTDTILRPGWEFNGGWYTWRAKADPQAFAEYWRQIVTTMRGVPGCEQLQFCWNPTLGDQDFPADEAWPGDKFVDYVGVDVYDETWNVNTYPWPADATVAEIAARQRKVWEEWIYYSPRGLKFWTEFAQKHSKPLAIPEWGLNRRPDGHGGQDNVHFIEQMHAFVNDPANRVAFHCYFDVNDSEGGNHQLSPGPAKSEKREGTEFPKSSARFKELFGK